MYEIVIIECSKAKNPVDLLRYLGLLFHLLKFDANIILYFSTQDKVLLNCSGGNCLRTKTVGTNEGGVATGYSCLDSPFLV